MVPLSGLSLRSTGMPPPHASLPPAGSNPDVGGIRFDKIQRALAEQRLGKDQASQIVLKKQSSFTEQHSLRQDCDVTEK